MKKKYLPLLLGVTTCGAIIAAFVFSGAFDRVPEADERTDHVKRIIMPTLESYTAFAQRPGETKVTVTRLYGDFKLIADVPTSEDMWVVQKHQPGGSVLVEIHIHSLADIGGRGE